ncbi:MAG: exopolysaccharide biosynthesis protein [Gammaproteobacteria bacterium]
MERDTPAAEPHDLEQLIERMRGAAQAHAKLDIGAIIEATGARSFAPLLVMVGLIAVSPLSGIPTVPSILGVLVILSIGQLLLGRDHLWLPRFVTRKTLPQDKYCRALRWLRRPARGIDRMLRPRLTVLTRGPGLYAMAVTCLLIACTMPPLELLPFVASLSGMALLLFGLAMIAHDGLVGLLAWGFTGFAVWIVAGPVI